MTKVSQKQAVFNAVVNVTGHKEGKCEPTTEQRKQISMILVAGFQAGEIELAREYSEPDLKAYVSGLMSNWLRKDTRLNGGEKYAAKNPGSRAGSSDPSLKAMIALKSTLTDASEIAEVESHINARRQEIAKTKQTKVVDFSVLPAELADKFGK